MAVANVVARFTADTGDLRRQMSAAQQAFGAVSDAATFSSARIREVGQSMADAGAKMTIGLTVPLGGVAIAATNAAMSFESNMNKIVGLVGIASDEVANMSDEVLAMAGNVGKGPDELAEGLFVVTSAGLRGSEAMATLGSAARAGAAGLGETNDIARAVAGALAAYGSEVLGASQATDTIVATARAGNFETSQFAAAIGRVLPFAEQAGASFQDMGGAVALLTRVNGNAAESVTQMSALFRAFVVPTEEAKTALDEVGLSAQDLRDSIAEKGLPATLEMLDKALGGNRERLGDVLGSSEAASAAFQILGADAKTIQDTFGVVADSAGMTAEAFASVADTTQFQVNQTMAELKATLVDLGQQFLPIVKAVMDFAQAHLTAFNSLPGPVKTMITVFAGLVAAIGPLLFIAGKLIVAFSSLLAIMLKTRAVAALRTAFVGLRGDLAAARVSMRQTQTSIGLLGTAAQTARIAVVTSFRAIGAAAKGLLASIGPVGIALVAVGVAFEVLVMNAAAAEARVDALTQALSEQGPTAQAAAAEVIAAALLANEWGGFLWIEGDKQNFQELADIAGVSMAEITAAVMTGGEQMEAVISDFRAAGEQGLIDPLRAAESVQAIQQQRDAYVEATKNIEIGAEATVIANEASGKSAREMAGEYRTAARNMTDSQRALRDAVNDGVRAVEALETAFTNLNDALSQEASLDNAKRSLLDLNEELIDGDKNLKGYTEGALDNREAIRQAAQAWIDYAAATSDPEEAQERLKQGQKEIKAALKDAGVDPQDSDIFRILKEQQQQSGETVDEFAKQRAKAAQYGNDVGGNFIDGIVSTLEARRDEVAAAASTTANAMNTGGNAGIDASSPSRTAMKVAENWTDGLTIGLRSGAAKVEREASAAAKRIANQFMAAMQPARGGGPASSAFESMFGSQEDIRNSGRALQDATWALADARDAVIEAERNLNKVRKDEKATAREVAAAERQLAQARRDAADAADAAKTAEFVAENQKALIALQNIVQQYDHINAALESVEGAFASLREITTSSFGQDTDIFGMFASTASIDQMVKGFDQVKDLIKDAYAFLTDPEAVGATRAKRNKARMRDDIKEIQQLAQAAVNLREQYDSNLQQIATLEKDYQTEVTGINARYNQLDKDAQETIDGIEDRFRSTVSLLSKGRDDAVKALSERWSATVEVLDSELQAATDAYDRENSALNDLVRERDGFLNSIRDGFRSFVNDFSSTGAAGVRQIQRETRKLANGVTVTLEREIDGAGGAAGIRAALESRLAEVRQFATNIRTLMERGLDPAIVREFVSAGVSGAGAAAAALAEGSADDLRAINAVQGELAREIGDFQGYAAGQFHDAAIAQQEAIVGPLEVARDQAQAALDLAKETAEQELQAKKDLYNSLIDAATVAYAKELKAAQDHAADLQLLRQRELDEAKRIRDTQIQQLEAENETLEKHMNAIATNIESIVTNLANKLPIRTNQAGQAAIDQMMAGFRKRFPDMKSEFGNLMDRLAASMNRVSTITIQTVYAAAPAPVKFGGARALGGPVVSNRAYLVGERGPELFLPGANGKIVPNDLISSVPSMGTRGGTDGGSTTINVTVNAGMGTDGAETGRQIVEAIRKYERRSGRVFVSA